MSSISPYLLYEDAASAIDFLTAAFGFTERVRNTDDGGRVAHAELELDGDVVMLGQPGEEYQSPKRSGHTTAVIHVYVDDLDAHYERARAAGATVMQEPEAQEYGERRYAVEDPEGHQWFFAERDTE